nr:hypothetical protein [Bacilli bacterium]
MKAVFWIDPFSDDVFLTRGLKTWNDEDWDDEQELPTKLQLVPPIETTSITDKLVLSEDDCLDLDRLPRQIDYTTQSRQDVECGMSSIIATGFGCSTMT